jgi:hypothetical protein
MGPRQSRSTILTLEEEAIIVAFRQRTLLALDDCFYARGRGFLMPCQPDALSRVYSYKSPS